MNFKLCKMKNLLFGILAMLLAAATFAQPRSAGEYTYSCECMGTEADGSETILAWGNGRNRADAVEQAKKNAVVEVIFNGIRKGRGDCNMRPLVPEVNARTKYDTYFNKFFADGGEYLDYVSLDDERLDDKITRDRQKGRKSINMSAVVRVQRGLLKEKFLKDNILKP
jgi:hypothetical protein